MSNEDFDEVLFEERLKAFQPDPLVTINDINIENVETFMVKENGIDLASANYYNFLNNDEIKKVAEETIKIYGVGTCGPRVFYGTSELHQDTESCLSKFLHMKAALVYPQDFMGISSSITAFCKKDDVIFIDEESNFSILHGCLQSKSKVVKFSHNNPEDFKQLVLKLISEDNKLKKYLILEGLSWQTGALCNLLEFLEVAEEFKIRVFLDETYTIGFFGKTGRGLMEHFDVDVHRVDLIFGTLQGAFASYGGFSATPIVAIADFQTMRAAGFAFSASVPAFLNKAVLKAIELLEDKPERFRQFAKSFHEFLTKECGFKVTSHPEAPFKRIKMDSKTKEEEVHSFCKEKGVHFICKESGLFVNLNIHLLEDKDKLERVYEVFQQASDLMS